MNSVAPEDWEDNPSCGLGEEGEGDDHGELFGVPADFPIPKIGPGDHKVECVFCGSAVHPEKIQEVAEAVPPEW